jgi:hypothetical protein
MERRSICKDFLLLIVGGLLALHVTVTSAAEGTTTPTYGETSDGCVL